MIGPGETRVMSINSRAVAALLAGTAMVSVSTSVAPASPPGRLRIHDHLRHHVAPEPHRLPRRRARDRRRRDHAQPQRAHDRRRRRRPGADPDAGIRLAGHHGVTLKYWSTVQEFVTTAVLLDSGLQPRLRQLTMCRATTGRGVTPSRTVPTFTTPSKDSHVIRQRPLGLRDRRLRRQPPPPSTAPQRATPSTASSSTTARTTGSSATTISR